MSQLKVWRLKLKGFDLYYKPTNGGFGLKKSNLSKTGKIYHRKPKITSVNGYVCVSGLLESKYTLSSSYKITSSRSWGQLLLKDAQFEVIEYNCEEVKD